MHLRNILLMLSHPLAHPQSLVVRRDDDLYCPCNVKRDVSEFGDAAPHASAPYMAVRAAMRAILSSIDESGVGVCKVLGECLGCEGGDEEALYNDIFTSDRPEETVRVRLHVPVYEELDHDLRQPVDSCDAARLRCVPIEGGTLARQLDRHEVERKRREEATVVVSGRRPGRRSGWWSVEIARAACADPDDSDDTELAVRFRKPTRESTLHSVKSVPRVLVERLFDCDHFENAQLPGDDDGHAPVDGIRPSQSWVDETYRLNRELRGARSPRLRLPDAFAARMCDVLRRSLPLQAIFIAAAAPPITSTAANAEDDGVEAPLCPLKPLHIESAFVSQDRTWSLPVI